MTAPASAVGEQGSSSTVKIIANLFISFIGAGILGLPYAFKESGVLEGVLVMSLVGAFSVKGMILVINCKYKILENPTKRHDAKQGKIVLPQHNLEADTERLLDTDDPDVMVKKRALKQCASEDNMNYGDVGYHAIGRVGRMLVDVALLISQLGFCCAYLIFISENLGSYVEKISKSDWLLIMLPFLFLLTLLRELHSLAHTSMFAQVSNLLAFLVVFWFDFEHWSHATARIHPKEVSLKGFPLFFAVSIYCYEGAGMILTLEQSVAKEKRHLFNGYFVRTMVAVTILYIVFGACGYMSFGLETNEIITLNLPKNSAIDFSVMVKCCLCLALFFTYPVMMFPVTKLLESRLLQSQEANPWYGNLMRLVLVGITGLTVMIIPNFANLMALVGSTCCTLLAFILPGFFHIVLFKGSLTRRQYLFDVVLIFLGVAGTFIGTYDTMKRMGASRKPNLVMMPDISQLNSSQPLMLNQSMEA
ncbi:PREDICTED: amino acid transporter ANTL1-like [Priapulus caudatus]|uniref:Amino acid transporter ANTL1-like n=1 Tax=Priapulus caudatus TaxID=37621 RepID=A0ABM1DQ02_PRICU|nr:PREDICTED: amino acid transporter ANTL1-like [Priapulus caudatus]